MEQSEVEENFPAERQQDTFQDVCGQALRRSRLQIHQDTCRTEAHTGVSTNRQRLRAEQIGELLVK